MSARFVFAAAMALIPMALSAPAHAGATREGLLPAPPAHAPPGVCYARVRQDARWSAPGPIRSQWRLRPGAGGPVWCWISDAGAPPVLLHPERHGWLRVNCHPVVRHVRAPVRPRPRAPRPVFAVAPPPPAPCCIPPTTPPPPPVVTIAVPAPPPPRSPWLSWSGKSLY